MIAVLILIPVIGFALFFFACYKTDRKILRQKEVEQLKSQLK